MKTKAKPPRELLSPRAFGALLGVSYQAVHKAISTGRLRTAVSKDERTGYHLIDQELGRAEWDAWTDPAKRQSPETRAGGRPVEAARTTPSLFDPKENTEALLVRNNLATTRTEQVALDVELKRLELETLRGAVIDKGEAQREYFRLARLVRDRLQAIPDRIAANLAALDKPAQVHQVLSEEIARALENLGSEAAAEVA